jgi:hypothetical protein
MEYQKLPISIRNSHIENISVVLNTLDYIDFPNMNNICKSDKERFKLINLMQSNLLEKASDKESIYKFCIAFEKNI